MPPTTDFRVLQQQNRRRTWALLAATFVLLGVVGSIVALMLGFGSVGMVVFVGLSVVLTAVAYRASPSVALAATGAVAADPTEYRQLHNLVEGVCIAAGLSKPKVYVVDDPAPNAFATGRRPEDASVAVTTGLLAKLNRTELEGVIAHELAHVRNHDIKVMTVAVATAGVIALIADLFWRILWFGGINGGRRSRNRDGGSNPIMLIGFIVVLVLAPLAAALLRAALSRSREGLADASAVEFTRNPSGLRAALEKLRDDVTVVRRTSHATSHLWIESPDDTTKGDKGAWFNGMFDTHPPLEERIATLSAMEHRRPGGDDDRAGFESVAESTAAVTPPAAAAAGGTAPGSGWYPDPLGGTGRRWWDGGRWTSHVA